VKQEQNISLRQATTDDSFEVYNWLYFSDFSDFIASLHSHINYDIPTYAEFLEGYPEYFFSGNDPEKGQSFIIQLDGDDVGHISYTSYHLLSGVAELDIWMKSNEYVGRRIGTTSLNLIIDRLKQKGLHTFIIRPSKKNIMAIKAYKRSGFIEKELEPSKYYKPEYIGAFSSGDYGDGNDVFFVHS